MKEESDSSCVLTVGHSTRSVEELLEMLEANGVQHLVDVRSVPRSRHNPQFNQDTLSGALEAVGIAYTHLKGLGGLRRARADSPNTGWENASFRGFADYMQSPAFKQALDELIHSARDGQVAILCAEAVPWRCHRSLIADALTVRGIPVEHILNRGRRYDHQLTRFAHVRGTRLTYPAPEGQKEEA